MSSGGQSTVHVFHTISGFTEHGMIEVWQYLYENKRERASSTQRKVVLLFSPTGVTSLAIIVPVGFSIMFIELCAVPGLRVCFHGFVVFFLFIFFSPAIRGPRWHSSAYH